jgi:arylsulfatase A-like enzyme
MRPTRREFLAAGAAVGAAAYTAACAEPGGRDTRVERPNVVVVVLDTFRADHAYGPRARTPAFDELTRRGLRFATVFPEAMPTVPARNSILSGRRQFPFRNWQKQPGLLDHAGWSALDDVPTAFPSVLRRAGWWTAYVTDNPFLGFASPYQELRDSFDVFVRHGGQIGGRDVPVPARLLNHWLHPALARTDSRERVRRFLANADYSHDERKSFAAQVFSSAMDTLDRTPRRRPFAMVVDSFEPHEPWTPPRQYVDLYGDPSYHGPEPATPRYGRANSWLHPDEMKLVLSRMRALYAAELTMTDHWLGMLLERVERMERPTLVLLVSDHGIFFGERGWTGKISVALHPELTQVPLVIVDPDGRRAGQESAYLASTHDVGPTILSMAGVRVPHAMDGTDLSTLFDHRSPPRRDFAYGGYSDQHYVRTGRWTYMSDNRFERPKLFDVKQDPHEQRDVAAEHPDVVAELQEDLRRRIGGRPPYYG